jgi:hypothetical protein
MFKSFFISIMYSPKRRLECKLKTVCYIAKV